MNHSENLLEIIAGKTDSFSKGQKRIANFILNQYDKAAYITAAKLGESVGVSESTVVRFASELGYDGYPDMQKALKAIVRTQLTAAQRIDVASDMMENKDIISSVLEADINNIRTTLANMNKDEFQKIADTILGAGKIYILGVRSAAALANFMAFYFNLILDNVYHVKTSTASEMFEQIFRIGSNDVIIGISFPRYSKRTLKAINFAKSRGATVIGVTDSSDSPVAKAADLSLIARSDMASFADSLVAPLSLINALIVAVSMKKKKEISDTFEILENIWDEYQVYEK